MIHLLGPGIDVEDRGSTTDHRRINATLLRAKGSSQGAGGVHHLHTCASSSASVLHLHPPPPHATHMLQMLCIGHIHSISQKVPFLWGKKEEAW
jgi:hypothetical protein